MNLFPNPLFWLYFLIFFVAVFVAFFIPGERFLKPLRLPFVPELILGTCLGTVLWGWQGYLFGYLHLRWLSFFYLGFFLFPWLNDHLPMRKNGIIFPSLRKDNLFPILLIIIGCFIQLSSVWFAGVAKDNGLSFYTYSLPDNIWYLDLTNECLRRIPPFEPGMSGKVIENYHYWSNLVMAELIRVFHLPLIPTVSQYFPFLLSLLLGGLLFIFVESLKLKRNFLLWLLFFIYFGGDFVNLIQFLAGRGIDFTQQSMEDGATFLANPPRAFALVLLFAGINFLILSLRKKSLYLDLALVLVLGSLIGFKVYVGIFALLGFIFFSLYFFLKGQGHWLKFTPLVFLLSLAIFLPVNQGSGGLTYVGFWRAEDFIVLPSLGLSRYELARQTFVNQGNWLRVWQYDLLFLFLFLLGTFGTKILGFFQRKQSLKLLPLGLNIFLIPSLLINLFLGTFFLQKSGGSNAFNFIVTVYIVGSIYSALACSYWSEKVKKTWKFLLISLIVILTIPRVGYRIFDNFNNLIRTKWWQVGTYELKAHAFLKEMTDPSSLVLSHPQISYFAFLADRPAFLQGEGILESHNINFSDRLKTKQFVFNSDKISLVREMLLENGINYLYTFSGTFFPGKDSQNFFETVYDKDGIAIIKVRKNR